MMTFDQRDALKVGDEVGVIGLHYAAVRTVTKRTKAQIVLSDGSRWGVSRGRKHGDTAWGRDSLTTAAQARERIAEIRERKEIIEVASRMEAVRWRNMPLVHLQRFAALLDELQPQPKP